MKIPHCRAKVKVRVRTGGENRTVLKWTTASRKCPCGGSPFVSGKRIVLSSPRVNKRTCPTKESHIVVATAGSLPPPRSPLPVFPLPEPPSPLVRPRPGPPRSRRPSLMPNRSCCRPWWSRQPGSKPSHGAPPPASAPSTRKKSRPHAVPHGDGCRARGARPDHRESRHAWLARRGFPARHPRPSTRHC